MLPLHAGRTSASRGLPLDAGNRRSLRHAEDREEALRLGRSHLSRYMRAPNYRNSWLRQGFREEDLTGEGSERLVEGLVAWGAEDDIRGRVREHLSAGADQVCVQVVTDGGAEDLREMWRSLAPVLLG